MARRYAMLLAALLLIGIAMIRLAPDVRGDTPCTGAVGIDSPCVPGGSYQVPDFFTGHATRGSAGQSWPAGSGPLGSWPAAISHQPVAYPVRPPWQVAGVDYAVGVPAPLAPSLANLTGRPGLKDPAQIATDPLANPDGPGADCAFVPGNSAVPHGVPAGTGANPFPFPDDGPGIYCVHPGGSAKQLILDGYNLGWNSRTGFGCVPVVIAGVPWGRGAAQDSADTAAIVVRNSLLVNGPRCNIWGELGTGANQAGPNSPSSAPMIRVGGAAGVTNTIGFYDNTVYGCGGDALADALERALCRASFNATHYAAGAIEGFVEGAAVGVAPLQSVVLAFGGNGTMWVADNAFVHLTSRFANPGGANTGAGQVIENNYIEGMTYTTGPHVEVAAITHAGGTAHVLTTRAPHGVPIGSRYAIALSPHGLADFPAGWARNFTMTATGPTALRFDSDSDAGDYHHTGSGAWPIGTAAGNHGEFTEPGGDTAAARFFGTIRGTTLSVTGLTGPLGPGQYITPAAGSGLVIPSPTYITGGSGDSWTLNQAPGDMAGAMVAPIHAIGAQGQPSQIVIRYNTVVMTASTADSANTAIWYISTGGAPGNAGVPMVQFTGSIDHNVMINDLGPGPSHRTTSAMVEFAYNALGPFAVTDNYVDPTGAYYCWPQLLIGPSEPLTLARNVNLLTGDDPMINRPDGYAVLANVPGTAPFTQRQTGIAYDPASGTVTVRLADAALPAGFGPGSRFILTGARLSTGPNLLAGARVVAGAAGNSFTFQVAPGATGNVIAANVVMQPLAADGSRQACYGHN